MRYAVQIENGAPKGAASGSPQRRFLCRHGPNPAERIVDALLDVAERLARAAERLADLGGVLLPVHAEGAVQFHVAALDALLAEVLDNQVDGPEAEVVFLVLDCLCLGPVGGQGVEPVDDALLAVTLVALVGTGVHEHEGVGIVEALGLGPVADAVLCRHVQAVAEMGLERPAFGVVGLDALAEDLENLEVGERVFEVAAEFFPRPARDAVGSELVRLLHEGVEGFEQTVFGVVVTLADSHDEVHLLFLGEVVLGGGLLGLLHRHNSLFPASMVGLDCFDAPVLGYRVMGRGVGTAARSRARPSGPLLRYVLLAGKKEFNIRILPYRFGFVVCKVFSQNFFLGSFGRPPI